MKRWTWAGAAAGLAIIGGLGASAGAAPARDALDCPAPEEVADAAEQRACGQEIYEEVCSECHEEPDGSGTVLDPELLADYYTAQAVYDYVIFSMPEDDPGVLPDADYWAVVAYLLDSRGLLDETGILGPETAEATELTLSN